MNRKQLEEYVKTCTIPGCGHAYPGNSYPELNVCPDCDSKKTIRGGHYGGTKFACLRCGRTWEDWV